MLIRFGAECDRCKVRHNDYSVEDIATCEDCGLDLCDECGTKTLHQEHDNGEGKRWRTCAED